MPRPVARIVRADTDVADEHMESRPVGATHASPVIVHPDTNVADDAWSLHRARSW